MKKLSFLFAALVTALTMSANEVTVSIADYATANHWENSKQYTSLVMDEAVSVTAEPTTGNYNNTGKYYTNGTNWRMYQNEAPEIIVKAEGGLLTSVTFTYEIDKTGVLIDADSAQVISGTAYALDNVASATFSVGNTDSTITNGQVRITAITVSYDIDSNAKFYNVTATVNDEKMGTVSGTGSYVENNEVSLKAIANPGYEFVKWSNESTDNPLKFTLTQDTSFTATFQALTPITIAEANVLEDGKKLLLNPFVVTQVQGSNTYIKDETGYSVIYKKDFGLVAGDTVSGLLGSKTTYKYHQIVPSVEKADLTIKSGKVPQPEEFTTAPVLADLYKYVKLDTVTVKSGSLVLKDSTSIQYYNATLTDGKKYNIVGSVGHYNGTLQIIVATNELLPGQEDTETPGEGEEPGEGETPATKVTFDFTTAEGLEALGIAYPATETTTEGAFCTDLEEGKTYTQEGVSLTAKHGSTATRVWLAASGAMDLRHYKNGVLTIAAPAGYTVVKIELAGGNVVGFENMSDNVWQGMAATVALTATANASTIKIKTITVTLAEADEDYVSTPTIMGEQSFKESTTVTITAAEGLKVYYTLDGTQPTNASTEYTAPFELTATTTVKAIAYNGDKASAVVEKTFTKMSILTCEEAVALCTPNASSEQYIIHGYVTELLDGGYSEQYKNITFWMADTQDGGQVLQAFRVKPVSEVEQGLQVGDFVEVTGTLVLYGDNKVPEVNAGGSVKLLERTALDNIAIQQTITKIIRNGQLLIIKDGVLYNAQGQVIK